MVTKVIDIGGNETVVGADNLPVRRAAKHYINCTDDRDALKAGAKDGDLLYYKDWYVIDHAARVNLGGARVMMFDEDRHDWLPQTNPAHCV